MNACMRLRRPAPEAGAGWGCGACLVMCFIWSRGFRPGGVLLYSTCTVTAEENENTVKAFLERNGEYTAEPFEVCGISAPEGMYTFWPNVDKTDGFFAAKLRRRQ